jgi:hypothetical protein
MTDETKRLVLTRPFTRDEEEITLLSLRSAIPDLADCANLSLVFSPLLIEMPLPWNSDERRAIAPATRLVARARFDPKLLQRALSLLALTAPSSPTFLVEISYTDGVSVLNAFNKTFLGPSLTEAAKPNGSVRRWGLTPQEKNEFYETFDSDLWRVCYPRTFTQPKCGRYASPKSLARMLIETGFQLLVHKMPDYRT